MSLRKYGYRMSEDKKSRRRCLKLAIKEKGIRAVLRRLDFLLVNTRYTKQTQKDIDYCLAKTMNSINIEPMKEKDEVCNVCNVRNVCNSISEFEI